MKLERYLITTEISGKEHRRIWDARKPLSIGHPELWKFERTAAGIEVTKYLDHAGRKAEDEPEVRKQFLVNKDLLTQPIQLKIKNRDEEISRSGQVSALSIQPARMLTPLFRDRMFGNPTRMIDVGEKKEGDAEVFAFTEVAGWAVSSEPLQVGFLRAGYQGFVAGKAVFKLQKKDDGHYVLQSFRVPLKLTILGQPMELAPKQVCRITYAQLCQTSIRLDPFHWRFAKQSSIELSQADESDSDPQALFYKKTRNVAFGIMLSAFVVLGLLPTPAPKPEPKPQEVKVEIPRETVVVVKPPEPKPTPEPPKPSPTPEPTPEPKATPTPEPPKPKLKPTPPPPKPPKQQVKPPPKPKVEPPKLPPPPKQLPPPPKAVTPPPPVQAAPPKPQPVQPPPVQAPPPPPAPEKQISSALNFLGAKTKVIAPAANPTQYQATKTDYSKINPLSPPMPNAPAMKDLANNSGISNTAISTRSSRQATGGVVSGSEVLGAKTLNQVQGKVDLSAVSASAEAILGKSGGLSVAGKGKISPEAVRKALQAAQNKIQFCYEKALLGQPTLSGSVLFMWEVGTDGRASGVRVVRSQLNNATLHDCVTKVIEGIPFPHADGGPADIEYPFSFTSSSL